MPSEKFYMGLKAIDALEAQEMLLDFTKISYPNLKEADRSKLHRKVTKVSDPFIAEKAVTTNDLKNMFNIEDILKANGKK
jgi:hypothetical protein